MLNLFRSKGSRKRAMVFVDYESWFYSYKTLYGMRPDPKAFRTSLEAEYEIEDIMVFGDFSSPWMAEELGKLRNITNTIIETGNTFNRRKKDMTDFIMLDYIYQYADESSKAGTYIIFTGDGHFQSVTKYLVHKKRKNVVVYGVRDTISRQLRDAASEVRELPTHEELRRYRYMTMKQQKKTLCIVGSMLLPIKIGEPALIREHSGGYRRTSTVLSLDMLTDNEIKFETQNTLYVLHLISPKQKGVAV